MILETLREWMGQVEGLLTDGVAKVAPWLCPIPTAFLVGRATIEHLEWPLWVGVVSALVVESLGLATTQTCLQLRGYNAEKQENDAAAPFRLSAILVGVYLLTALGLTVMLDIVPALVVYSSGVFPLLSLCGMITLALRADHARRLKTIESVKQEKAALKEERNARRQATRQANRQASVKQVSKKALGNVVDNANMTHARQCRQAKKDNRLDSLVTFYNDNPDAGPTEAGRAIGVARQTIYTYLNELETAGRVSRGNGNVKVVG